jgi:hypothetical protein
MSKDAWEAMRGYAEWPMYSWRLDGLPIFQALAGGLEEVDLAPPMVAYHLEHGAGSGWTPEGARRLFERLDAAGIPYLTPTRYDSLIREVLRDRPRFHPFNGPDWGLADADLPVTRPAAVSG